METIKISTYTGFKFTPEEYVTWLNNISNKDKDLEAKNLSSAIKFINSMLKTIYSALVIGIVSCIVSIVFFAYTSFNIGLINYITTEHLNFIINVVYTIVMAYSVKLNVKYLKTEKGKLELFNFILSKIEKNNLQYLK